MMARAARSKSAVSSTTTGGLPGPATIARFACRMAARATAGPPVTHNSATPGCLKIASAVSSVGSVMTQIRLSIPRSLEIASLKRRTPSAATRRPPGCGLNTTVLPAAIMLMALPVMVGSEWVTGVTAPITPKGACSITVRPWSPLKTSLARNSTPRASWPSVFSFSIL